LVVLGSFKGRVSLENGYYWQTHSRGDAPYFKPHGDVLG